MMSRNAAMPLLMGVIGGIALSAAAEWSTTRITLLVYVLSILLAALYVRTRRMTAFRDRFDAVLIAFVTESVLFYGYNAAQNVALHSHFGTFGGHLWRLAFIVGLGALISGVMAFFTTIRASQAS